VLRLESLGAGRRVRHLLGARRNARNQQRCRKAGFDRGEQSRIAHGGHSG